MKRASRRGRKSTACMLCHLAHRACDEFRPCRRCVKNGTEHDCLTPHGNGSEQRGGEVTTTQLSRKRKHEETNSEPITTSQRPPYRRPFETIGMNGFVNELTRSVRQLGSSMKALCERQDQLQGRVDEIQVQLSTPCIVFAVSDRTEAPASQLRTRVQQQSVVQSSVSNDFNMELYGLQHRPAQPIEFAERQETLRIPENIFLPFALEDATKPFVVFGAKIDLGIFQWMTLNPSLPLDMLDLVQCSLFAASQSFYDFIKYQEEELLGLHFQRIIPPGTRISGEEDEILPYMLPQSPAVPVSPVLQGTKSLQCKDGIIYRVAMKTQLFYSEDGTVSFGVASVDNYWHPLPPMITTTTHVTNPAIDSRHAALQQAASPTLDSLLDDYFPDMAGVNNGNVTEVSLYEGLLT